MGLGAAASGFQGLLLCRTSKVDPEVCARPQEDGPQAARRWDATLPTCPTNIKVPPSMLKMSYGSEGLEVCLAPWHCILSLAVAGVQQGEGGADL